MNTKQHWVWFVLACLLALAAGWTHRYEYAACDTDGCVAIHRWTGAITFREARWVSPPVPEGQVVLWRVPRERLRSGRPGLHLAAYRVHRPVAIPESAGRTKW